MSSTEQYTVGWICALPIEYLAARAFLEKRHDRLEEISPNDNNHYTLGEIGGHQVVIAVLPNGEYGTSSAACVARDMLHSFPNIRFGLMVGIGGGAPTKQDIRLGDIVVSSPRSGHGGLLQYDFGKEIQGHEFHQTGFLNQPPRILRSAVTGLQMHYEENGHQLKESIQTVVAGNTRLGRKFASPPAESDRLYDSQYTHLRDSQSDCAEVCDVSKLIRRPQRGKDKDYPTIHYGLIASGNRLMKDAIFRDKLAAEQDILCFEMEAAGLMNHFPCLVIRGVCDYADSHKNKEWQGYAAIMAAAYAKDLLHQIIPQRVKAERKASEILDCYLDCMQRQLHEMSDAVGKMHSHHQRHQQGQEDQKILDWLTPINYGKQQSDYISRRQPGTCQWFLKSVEYQTWLASNNQTLFCTGIPGAGKTILTSTIVQDVCSKFHHDSTIGIAYIYCESGRHAEQKTLDIVTNLLKQLARHVYLPHEVKDLYEKHKRYDSRPSLPDIMDTLLCLARGFSRVFIIIDALDECDISGGCRAMLLSVLVDLCHQVEANLFATSRMIPDIIERFRGSISLEIRATSEDIQNYVSGCMRSLPSFVEKNFDLQNKIRITIPILANGMFLLASMHMIILIQQPTEGDMELALQDLPRGLEEAYNRTMLRIEKQGNGFRNLAKRVLSWLFHAKRLLSTIELQHAVAIKPGKHGVDEKFIPTIEMVGSVCEGLVLIDCQRDTVRLVHYTVREYFERTHETWFPKADMVITTACITYLSFIAFETGFCQTDEEFEERVLSNPLYRYAACNWGHHAREASELEERILHSFLESNSNVEAASQALLVTKSRSSRSNYSQEPPRRIQGLHLAAYFGLIQAVNSLLRSARSLHSKDTHGLTPLSWSVIGGHEAIVMLLLANGAEADSRANDGRTPVSFAAENGNASIIEILLKRGARADSKAANGRSPLSYAAESGHENVILLLLRNSMVNVNSQDANGSTPLSWLFKGFEKMESVRQGLLASQIQSGEVNINFLDDGGQALLCSASGDGDQDRVKMLLKKGANPDSSSADGRTPLSFAAQHGHGDIIHALLEERANPDSPSADGRTPLSFAAQHGHGDIIHALLEKRANPDSPSADGRTPLSFAAQHGHGDIVHILLEKRANPDSPSADGRTPLSFAAQHGHGDIVHILLEKRANPDSSSADGRTPLSFASEMGFLEIVSLLIATTNIEPDSKDRYGCTPLFHATINGHGSIITLLLSKCTVDPNVESEDGQTPLLCATRTGDLSLAQRLLQHERINVNQKTKTGMTALLCAAENHHQNIFKEILQKGSNVEALEKYPHEALPRGSCRFYVKGEWFYVKKKMEY